jgi:predicted DNA-binding antitoxin AbrB/MazE fold protein
MTTTLIATYSNGVFKPETPLDLPENAKVELTLKEPPAKERSKPKPGTPEAWEAYMRRCRESPLHSGVGWQGRDELYDRR